MSEAALEKGRKLLHLYRRGVGGERENAGRLLQIHLKTHDLTLYDLNRSLPVSQDLAALDQWRESAGLIAQLGTPAQDEALSQLVDAQDLTEREFERLLAAVDLEKLIELRADGWAFSDAADADAYRQVGWTVSSAEVLALSGSLAQRLHQAVRLAHHRLTHPMRLIRTEHPLHQQFVAGMVQALSGHPAQLVPEGVRAYLNADQLARLRALLAQHASEAEQVGQQAAFAFGEQKGRGQGN